MLRKTFVIISIMLIALSGCTGKSKNASVTGAQGPTVGAPGAAATTPGTPASPATCPTAPTRKLAKTRFITNAGLAAGAFKRYIYEPYRKNAFKKDAPGHKRAIVKAAAAAVFVLDQLRRARANAQADPTLCRVLIGPIDRLNALFAGLAAKLKRGEVDPTDIAAASGGIEGFRREAGSAGAGFKDKEVPGSAIGG